MLWRSSTHNIPGLLFSFECCCRLCWDNVQASSHLLFSFECCLSRAQAERGLPPKQRLAIFFWMLSKTVLWQQVRHKAQHDLAIFFWMLLRRVGRAIGGAVRWVRTCYFLLNVVLPTVCQRGDRNYSCATCYFLLNVVSKHQTLLGLRRRQHLAIFFWMLYTAWEAGRQHEKHYLLFSFECCPYSHSPSSPCSRYRSCLLFSFECCFELFQVADTYYGNIVDLLFSFECCERKHCAKSR